MNVQSTMADSEPFLESPDGTREEIMRATYLALCEHGYADLTVERIGDHFPKSKSLIYHHYDGKDDLLLSFLSFLLERFEADVPFEDDEGPEAHLDALLDHMLAAPLPDRRREFMRAMVELRAQAAHDERYRDYFTRHDAVFAERIAAVVEAGVEAGAFAPVDPDAVADFLLAAVVGGMHQRVTSDRWNAEEVREAVDEYVETVLEAA
jgi:AcrR family transcriptional regulator